ncbi:MAG TPA: aspartate aminotransferase family protein [Bacteroidota bacterium]|nr:aspartate aminotransferase family protein [Bacteroidota bacterium]
MNLHDREAAALFHTYKRLPLDIERGEGVHLIARDGRRYLDMFAGLAVNALGYAHPRVTQAIGAQASRFTHLSNYFLQESQVALAELLARHSGYPRVFFSNSGAEAIEGALKIARKWGAPQGKTDILALSNSFHGRTMGALSLMDRPKYRDGFGPFLDHCCVIPFNDVAALRKAVGGKTAAVVLEFIQGEGGIRPVSAEFARTLAALREEFRFLLVADEIQSGVGRTGKFFAFQHYGVQPDLVTLAKPIGGGLPLGAVLAGEEIASVLQPGMHGTTFGGNPVACAAGTAVLAEIEEKNLISRAALMGGRLMNGLRTLAAEFPNLIREVRGYGLMVGAELDRPGDGITDSMREKGILINCTDTTVLRFLPPLIIGEEDVDLTITTLRGVLAAQ